MIEVSAVRLFAVRLAYLLNFVGAVFVFWPALLNPARPLGLVDGSAFSLWATMTTLMGLGLRYPLQMLPLLLLQLLYKTVWFVAVALPLRSAGQWDARATEFALTFGAAVALDLLVIPWPYVLANYVKRPGESWKLSPTSGRDHTRKESSADLA